MPGTESIASLSTTRAAAASAERIDLACVPDEDDVGTPFTRLLRYDKGTWTTTDIDQQTESLCQFHQSAGKTSLLAMSREGNLLEVDDGGSDTTIEDASLRAKPYQLGHLSTLRQAGASLYAVGAGGQAYQRQPDGAWRVMSEELLDGPHPDRNWILEYARNPKLFDDTERKRQYTERMDAERAKRFWTLAGSSETAIYFGGERTAGLLYFWDGARVSPCKLPTEEALRDIMIAPDGTVWICGRDGIVLKGRELHFELVADLGPEHRLASLAWFDDRLYLGASSGPVALFAFDGQRVQPVVTGLANEPVDAHTIAAVGEALWVVGSKGLARLVGQEWQRIPIPGVSD